MAVCKTYCQLPCVDIQGYADDGGAEDQICSTPNPRRRWIMANSPDTVLLSMVATQG